MMNDIYEGFWCQDENILDQYLTDLMILKNIYEKRQIDIRDRSRNLKGTKLRNTLEETKQLSKNRTKAIIDLKEVYKIKLQKVQNFDIETIESKPEMEEHRNDDQIIQLCISYTINDKTYYIPEYYRNIKIF
jgi:hypothetical protein